MSCPLCRDEKRLCERTASLSLESPSFRASSPEIRLRLWLSALARLIADLIAFATLIGCAIPIQNYNPDHGRALELALLDEEGNELGWETGSIIPVCLCRLAKLAQAAAEQNKTPGKITARIASLSDTLQIARQLEDPPPQLLLVACLFFAFAIAALQHSHKADIYLNRILVLGLMIGCAAAFQTTNVLMGMKSYLAWSAILALLLSVLVHWAMRLWQGRHTLEEEPEMMCQLHDKSCDPKDGQSSQGGVVQKASQP